MLMNQNRFVRRRVTLNIVLWFLTTALNPAFSQRGNNPIVQPSGHYFLPSDFDGSSSALNVSRTANVAEICRSFEGLDMVRAFTGASSCRVYQGADSLRTVFDIVLLVDDTQAMSQYLLTMLHSKNALQEVSDRAVVKPTQLLFTSGTGSSASTLRVLLIGETAYQTGLSMSGWFATIDALPDTTSISKSAPLVSPAISSPAPAFPFIAGRVAHNHKASSANWVKVQADANKKCTLSNPSAIECACANLAPETILNWAASPFKLSGAAQTHFDHYAAGTMVDLNVDGVLARMLKSDVKVQGLLASEIKKQGNRGHFFLRQKNYGEEEFHNAFGGIDRVDYRVDTSAKTVEVWFKDRYDFHPVGFGYKKFKVGDVARNTNCVHAAAVEMKRTVSAGDFWMYGHATIKLSLLSKAKSGGSTGNNDIL